MLFVTAMLRACINTHLGASYLKRSYATAAEYIKTITEYDTGSGGVNAFTSVNKGSFLL